MHWEHGVENISKAEKKNKRFVQIYIRDIVKIIEIEYTVKFTEFCSISLSETVLLKEALFLCILCKVYEGFVTILPVSETFPDSGDMRSKPSVKPYIAKIKLIF